MFSNYLASLYKPKRPNKLPNQQGFGLVELLISVSIMVIVSAVVLVQQNAFNSAILLRSQAYSIALDLREVQLSAVSSANSDGTGDFRSVLGIHFIQTPGSNQQYTMFRDSAGGNRYFDAGEAFGEQGVVDRRFEITDINVNGTHPSGLSIIFVRPNFDAEFYADLGAGVVKLNENSVLIEISRTGTSDPRTVEVTSTGQISVIN